MADIDRETYFRSLIPKVDPIIIPTIGSREKADVSINAFNTCIGLNVYNNVEMQYLHYWKILVRYILRCKVMSSIPT